MKNLIVVCLLTLVANANAKNTQRGCYQAFGWKDVKAPASDQAWDKLLEARVNHEVTKCYNGEKDVCLAGLLVKLGKCEDVGGKKFRQYVAEIRRSAEAHAEKGGGVPAQKAVGAGK